MAGFSLMRFLNPWRHKREAERARVEALRQRDGDACRRCRRPIRFDLSQGHDQGARIEAFVCGVEEEGENLANLCLTHGKCNVSGLDHTDEVFERLRPQREAELFAKAREKRAA